MDKFTFIDLFAGCGGLSLGLMQAGWQGIFAVERNEFAFQSLKHNLIDSHKDYQYNWPLWLPQKNMTVSRLLKHYRKEIECLKGQVDLVAGGPPCQGFSSRGIRSKSDSRNNSYKDYIKFVELVEPKFLLIENVRGIDVDFKTGKKNKGNKKSGRPTKSFARRITDVLSQIGYDAKWNLVKAVEYGVPQFRPRYIMIGIKRDNTNGILKSEKPDAFFELLSRSRHDFFKKKGLEFKDYISVREAISDLKTEGCERIDCVDSPGFKQITYGGPITNYQKIMHGKLNGDPPNSLRLAKHRKCTLEMFKNIMNSCRPGVSLGDKERAKIGLSKHRIVWLDARNPSHTLTTLPDDLLHYSEPRILTVRECARLQAFPDWFEFKGNYTTGGNRRKKDCPRYTQVGNAVPPLLAEAMGDALKNFIASENFPS